ncbi:penicillin-binding protein [Candidatus Deferrimicrobium sp.]|uniref:penicillin-binding protein n=1 Tax=Candidatus Deferrimicrobium sp. TaxID=3060586 RepID=UPI002ED9CBCC
MTSRARLILGVLLSLYVLVVLRAFQIQVLGVREIRDRGAKQYSSAIPLLPQRGVILDRTGTELAVSISTKSIFVQPAKLRDPDKAADLLAPRVSRSARELRKLFSREKGFVWVRRQMPSTAAEDAVREVKQALSALDPQTRGKPSAVEGIGTVEEPKRFYPNRELAASLVGFTNLDSEGMEGVELSLNRYLRGERGSLLCERDARGRLIVPPTTPVVVNSKGHSVALTIDRNIQHVAESELQAAVEKYNARGGMAVVLSPGTGEILAMATAPSFNPNTPARGPAEARKNRSLTDSFEPGSTFKVFTLASAIELGAVSTTDRFFCENGSYHYAGKVIHDTHRYGWLTAAEVVKFSSNIGITKINDRMDGNRFYDMIRAFGFGSRTGIELRGEVPGIAPSRDGFKSRIRRATVSFGQGISVTPLQLAAGMAAVINGGKVMKPYLVREIRDPEGKTVFRGGPEELRRVLSPKTSAQMREILGKVVEEDGTGTQARIKGFLVGGKTGTAQKVEPGSGRYSATKRTASFIGFLPRNDPKLLILVVIDEPRGNVYGGVVAAPAFNQIAVKTAYYLGIQPTETVALAAVRPSGPSTPSRVTRVSTARTAGAMVMPDLSGMSMGRVVDIMGGYSVKLSLTGSGVARAQTPDPGAVLVPGTECSVTFTAEPPLTIAAGGGAR